MGGAGANLKKRFSETHLTVRILAIFVVINKINFLYFMLNVGIFKIVENDFLVIGW